MPYGGFSKKTVAESPQPGAASWRPHLRCLKPAVMDVAIVGAGWQAWLARAVSSLLAGG